MNRTILIVICDFLLVSLLAFSTIDINRAANPTSAQNLTGPSPANAAETNRVTGRQDLGDVMRLALEEEKKSQESLATELSRVRATASQQQAALNQREEQLQAIQGQLRSRETESARLMEQQTNLLHQMSVAQNNIENLNQQLHSNQVETVITREERAAQEAEAKRQEQKAAALRAQLSALERSNQVVTAQREQLAGQLQLTEAQRQAAAAQLALAEQDLSVQRRQNTNLAENVKALATQSSELVREIRENRPLAANTIFDQFSTNRVNVNFYGSRPGFFGGEATRNKQTQSILVTDGTNIFAVCHIHDTLLSLMDPSAPWDDLTGTLARGSASVTLAAVSFYVLDPRIVLMPIPAEQARELGCGIYPLSTNLYQFQDTVVIGARGGYYGECNFQIDLSAPQYLRMDHNSLKGLFGKFNPSTGDLVFSKTGQLLGMMANNTYCVILRKFESAATIRFDQPATGQPLAETLAALYSTVQSLPYKLQ